MLIFKITNIYITQESVSVTFYTNNVQNIIKTLRWYMLEEEEELTSDALESNCIQDIMRSNLEDSVINKT